MLVLRVTSQIAPRVALFDFSGTRAGFGVVMMAIDAAQSTLSPVTGQRTGSRAVVKAAKPPPVPASAGFGARKPSAYVARNATVRIGVILIPSFGVVELIPFEYESLRSAADSSTCFSTGASTSPYTAVTLRLPS